MDCITIYYGFLGLKENGCNAANTSSSYFIKYFNLLHLPRGGAGRPCKRRKLQLLHRLRRFLDLGGAFLFFCIIFNLLPGVDDGQFFFQLLLLRRRLCRKLGGELRFPLLFVYCTGFARGSELFENRIVQVRDVAFVDVRLLSL